MLPVAKAARGQHCLWPRLRVAKAVHVHAAVLLEKEAENHRHVALDS